MIPAIQSGSSANEAGVRRATFVCGGRTVPSSRFRVDPIAGGLLRRGWEANVIYGYGNADRKITARPLRLAYRAACRVRRAALTSLLPAHGPAVLQKLALPWFALPEVVAKRRGAAIVFDFDDAIFLNARGGESALRGRAVQSVLALADHVVAGNAWLASFVADPGKVSVLPTCIDTNEYRPDERAANDVPVIGWMGTAGNLKYLRALGDPLRRLRGEGRAFRFVVVSDVYDRDLLVELGAEFEPWSAKREISLLNSFDVGTMPLADDDWCRGKCGFKLIQYMAVGIPVVASSVGFNRGVVRHGTDGFLVGSADWFEALHTLLGDDDMRKAMGRAGRQHIVDNFDVERATGHYEQILERLQ